MSKEKKSASRTLPMRILDEKGIPYATRQQTRKHFTAQGVADDIGVPVAQVVKAMIVRLSDGQFALVVIPGDKKLSLKKVGAALKDKKIELAQARDVERVTGYQVGAVSVLGFRRREIPSYLDQSLLELEQVIISSGKPDAGLALSPTDLLQGLEGRQLGDFCQ